jgi:chemotaxis protein MotB
LYRWVKYYTNLCSLLILATSYMKNFVLLFTLALFIASCVNPRKYEDLNTSYTKNQGHLRDCRDSSKYLAEENTRMKVGFEDMEKRIVKLRADSTEMNTVYAKQKRLYDDLNVLYEQLLKRTEGENQKNLGSLKEMEASLIERERKLRLAEEDMAKKDAANKALQAEIGGNQKELAEKVSRVKELEARIAAKDSLTNALKKSISDALTGFSDADLTVTIKDGKVYVSLSEQLLFASGSIVVDKKGKDALVQLGKALQSKPDINILVEGHTDDVPMNGAIIKDNWDLSVLRATSITKILVNDGGIDPTRVIASGRSQYFPVATGKTSEARKKNRRTEIILSPKLDELYKLLNQK